MKPDLVKTVQKSYKVLVPQHHMLNLLGVYSLNWDLRLGARTQYILRACMVIRGSKPTLVPRIRSQDCWVVFPLSRREGDLRKLKI